MKNEAAVALGRQGGLAKLKKHGREEFRRMSEKAAIARKLKKQKCDTTISRVCPRNGLKYLPNGKCPCYE